MAGSRREQTRTAGVRLSARSADTYGMGLGNPIHLILLLVELVIPVLVVMALIKYLCSGK